MKRVIFTFLALLPLLCLAQANLTEGTLIIKKIVKGKVCDTCLVTRAGNLFATKPPLFFLTPNNANQFLYPDSAMIRDFTTIPRLKYFIAPEQFSLDFLPRTSLNLKTDTTTGISIDMNRLEFQITLPNSPPSRWKNVTDLPADPDFYFGIAKSDNIQQMVDKPETISMRQYHAGKFALNINDSLSVAIRDSRTLRIVQNFSICRIRSVPNFFEFIQFPSSKGFEEILNSEINIRNKNWSTYQHQLEMTAGNSGLIRFVADEQYYFYGRVFRNSGIQYSFDDKPKVWKDLAGADKKFTTGFSYIFIENPEPGKIIGLRLRYKHQKESVHKVIIKVKPVSNNRQLTQIGLFAVEILPVFVLIFYFVRKRHKKQLSLLNNKKTEIENKLQLLQGQLNPHFLFNSLNAVQSLIKQNDIEKAGDYIAEVASFMRTVMDTGRKEWISLQEEVEMEENYILLEQKRNPFKYIIENNFSGDLSSVEFPPLLLQPIIENSIRHGFGNLATDPLLMIEINCVERDLILIVSDNGSGYLLKEIDIGHGLSLTKKRIELLNEKLQGMQINMSVFSAPGSGTRTEITFKKWLE